MRLSGHVLLLLAGTLLYCTSNEQAAPVPGASASGSSATSEAGGSGRGGGGLGGAGTTGGSRANGGLGAEGGTDVGPGAGAPPSGAGHWQPAAGTTWQWQLSEPVTQILDVDVYDIDWETDAKVVAALHAEGKKVICYVSVGSWEDFRSDAAQFSEAVIGADYAGWPGEKYLDIRADATRARMLARFDVCRAKGFDAVEPDNMDVFELGSDSGFPLTSADGVDYARWLADAVHGRGMGIGQKNTGSLTDVLEPVYDWVLTESCYSDGNWCGDVAAYADDGKPVFMCEYEARTFAAACTTWKRRGYSPILKDMDLGSAVTFCP